MKVLAVETATSWQSVAILDESRVLVRHDQDAAGSHAKLLLPTINRLLHESGLTLTQLEGLVVSIGPGSFTGLRVGLATLLAFRTITQLPLMVVPTLEGMAWNLRGTSTLLCPILNSRRGELYWALFRWTDDNRLERVMSEQVGTAAMLGSCLTGSGLVFGEGWTAETLAIRASMPSSAMFVEAPNSAMKPSAVSIGLAGIERFQRGEYAGTGISPLYVQRTAAELKYEESGGLSPIAQRQERVARKVNVRAVAARTPAMRARAIRGRGTGGT
ncbi:MAG TPA: tRNA (adenosine(37)-N6)-threonylcarbamoyltransferase complex dimerization subunit type 1 TsaB [Nitrospiraceae bacterium]|nr:tRNA (adenosine(37)-N6)-threonylcarbamoyltransferase complex dimerization subunit type 1 TsaB [Nitrospiraceae bacterium]